MRRGAFSQPPVIEKITLSIRNTPHCTLKRISTGITRGAVRYGRLGRESVGLSQILHFFGESVRVRQDWGHSDLLVRRNQSRLE